MKTAPPLTHHTPVCTRTLGVHAGSLLCLTIHIQANGGQEAFLMCTIHTCLFWDRPHLPTWRPSVAFCPPSSAFTLQSVISSSKEESLLPSDHITGLAFFRGSWRLRVWPAVIITVLCLLVSTSMLSCNSELRVALSTPCSLHLHSSAYVLASMEAPFSLENTLLTHSRSRFKHCFSAEPFPSPLQTALHVLPCLLHWVYRQTLIITVQLF